MAWKAVLNRRENAQKPRNSIVRRCNWTPGEKRLARGWTSSHTEQNRHPAVFPRLQAGCCLLNIFFKSRLRIIDGLSMTSDRTRHRASNHTSSIFLGETWLLAFEALRANKVRALLTMLGVVIGSGCIVMVVTIGLAGRRYIIGQIESVGANLVYATVIRAGVSRPITLDDQISPADLNAIKETIPQINEVAGYERRPYDCGGR